MNNAWKKMITFRGKRSVESPVGENTARFYPNRVALLEQARDLSGPVASAINRLMVDTTRDAKSEVKRLNGLDTEADLDENGDAPMMEMQEVITHGVSLEIAQYRSDERGKAVETLIETVMDTRNRLLFGAMFMDSMRDMFPYRKNRSAEEIEEFLYGNEDGDDAYDGIDLPVFVQLLTGWMKANSKTFGSLGKKMVEMAEEKLEGLDSFEGLSDQAKPTSGETSKTPTSPPSDGDSEPTSSTS